MWAAYKGHLEVVNYLVQEAGADKDKEEKVRVEQLQWSPPIYCMQVLWVDLLLAVQIFTDGPHGAHSGHYIWSPGRGEVSGRGRG
jgi:hypothetical protein